MKLPEQIQQIINQRKGLGDYEGKGHLSVIQNKKDYFDRVKDALTEYNKFRQLVLSQIESKIGEYYMMAVEDPTFEDRVKNADPTPAILKINESIERCEYLIKRFDRDTINISVVGRARQGKSRLLQSISGVDNTIIPADDAGDCTGTTSEICNFCGKGYAKIEFYSEKEMLDQISPYLSKLDIHKTISSVSIIPSLSSELEKLALRDDLTAEQGACKNQLEKYVDHFKEYSQYLGTSNDIELDDVREYVAQYKKDGTPTFKYLAVKRAQIFSQFPYPEAGKIVLVDTIGIGDTALGIENKMLDILKNDSDAAILVRLPAASGDNIRKEDNDLYQLIADKMGVEMLDKWLFYVLNVCDVLKNYKSGDTMRESIKKQSYHIANLFEVNCGSELDVQDNLLIPILKYLADNLKIVDSNLLKNANATFAQAFNEYFILCSKIGNVINGGLSKNLKADSLFDQLWRENFLLGRRLSELENKYKQQGKCQRILEEISKTTQKLYNSCPTKEDILFKLKSGIQGGQAQAVFVTSASAMRADLIERFEEINHSVISFLQETIKEEIIQILRQDDGGRLDRICLNSDSPIDSPQEWLTVFIDHTLKEYDAIRKALQDVVDYRLNIEGLLEYRVNCALTCLDPYSPDFVKFDVNPNESFDTQAERMEQVLLSTIPDIANCLLEEKNINDILMIPFNSFYARIRKLHDKLFYSNIGNTELKEFYRENRCSIWREEFSAIVEKQQALGLWSEINEKMNDYRDKTKFNICF